MPTKKQQKPWQKYWRITLYLDRQEDYETITAAADLQRMSSTRWLLRHALRLARKELQKAQE